MTTKITQARKTKNVTLNQWQLAKISDLLDRDCAAAVETHRGNQFYRDSLNELAIMIGEAKSVRVIVKLI